MKHSLRIVLVLPVVILFAGLLRAGPVVFPFENRGNEASQDWIGYGLAVIIEDMTEGVGLYDRLQVIGEMDLPEGMPLTLASRIQVARKAGANQLITGWFEIQEDELAFEVQIYDLDNLKKTDHLFSVGKADLPHGVCNALTKRYGWKTAYPSGVNMRTFERYVKGTLAAAFYGKFEDLQHLQKEDDFPKLSMRLGAMLFHEGAYRDAMDALLNGNDQSPERMYLAGVAGIRSQQYDRALTCFLRALQDETDIRCLINAAGCLLMEGKTEEAMVVLDSVEQGTADMPIQFNRAIIQAVQEKPHEALVTMKMFLESQRLTEDVREFVSYCCARLPEGEHSDLCVVTAEGTEQVNDEPDVKQLYRFAGFKRLDKAMPDVAALKSFYLSAGKRYVAVGDIDQAADNLRKVLYLDPVHREALQLMCDSCNDTLSCEILKRLQESVDGKSPTAEN